MVTLKIKKLPHMFKEPTQANKGDFYDLYAANNEDIVLIPGDRRIIPLGFCAKIEPSCYNALIFPRSGNAIKNGLTLINCVGVVDDAFPEQWCVLLVNHGRYPVTVKRGDRVAQLQFILKPEVNFEFVDEIDYGDSTRISGLGSTGR